VATGSLEGDSFGLLQDLVVILENRTGLAPADQKAFAVVGAIRERL